MGTLEKVCIIWWKQNQKKEKISNFPNDMKCVTNKKENAALGFSETAAQWRDQQWSLFLSCGN